MKKIIAVLSLVIVSAVVSALFTLNHVQVVNVADDSITLAVYGQSWEYGYTAE